MDARVYRARAGPCAQYLSTPGECRTNRCIVRSSVRARRESLVGSTARWIRNGARTRGIRIHSDGCAMVSNTINQLYLESSGGRPISAAWPAGCTMPERAARMPTGFAPGSRAGRVASCRDKPAFVSLPRLVPSDRSSGPRAAAGLRRIEASDFNLFGRFMREGADAIEPVLKERASLGTNMLRVWGAYLGTRRSKGDRASDSRRTWLDYDELPQFLNQCAAHQALTRRVHRCTAGPIPGHWEKCGAALPRRHQRNRRAHQ